jgi:hypothetical protein
MMDSFPETIVLFEVTYHNQLSRMSDRSLLMVGDYFHAAQEYLGDGHLQS